jgi:uncharacterized protein
MEFDWDDGNIQHIARHNLFPQEVEAALLDPRRVGVSSRKSPQEKRWAMLGSTSEGRILFVVFTRRDGFIRVVTARDATDQEKRTYRRR